MKTAELTTRSITKHGITCVIDSPRLTIEIRQHPQAKYLTAVIKMCMRSMTVNGKPITADQIAVFLGLSGQARADAKEIYARTLTEQNYYGVTEEMANAFRKAFELHGPICDKLEHASAGPGSKRAKTSADPVTPSVYAIPYKQYQTFSGIISTMRMALRSDEGMQLSVHLLVDGHPRLKSHEQGLKAMESGQAVKHRNGMASPTVLMEYATVLRLPEQAALFKASYDKAGKKKEAFVSLERQFFTLMARYLGIDGSPEKTIALYEEAASEGLLPQDDKEAMLREIKAKQLAEITAKRGSEALPPWERNRIGEEKAKRGGGVNRIGRWEKGTWDLRREQEEAARRNTEQVPYTRSDNQMAVRVTPPTTERSRG